MLYFNTNVGATLTEQDNVCVEGLLLDTSGHSNGSFVRLPK